MLSLPTTFISVMAVFAPLFSKPVWQQVKVLLTGAILAPGKRTVTSALCVMGLSAAAHFQTYHRVLNRTVWSPLGASRLLLRLLVAVFVPSGVVVFGLDETIERRRGAKIKAKGIYRDPVRSSRSHFVKVSGLRWLGCMLLTPMRWANRVWALPLMTVLCPSEHFYEQRGRRAQTLVQRAWQMIHVVVRWLPGRVVVFVADSSYAALELLHQVSKLPHASLITRLRLDSALYDPSPAREPGQIGRPRLKGNRRPTLEAVLVDEETPWSQLSIEPWYGDGPREVAVATDPAVWPHAGQPPVARRWGLIRDPQAAVKPQAVLSTTVAQTPTPILPGCVRRWTREVTRAEARAHLGMATQRQWPERASARTTPAVLSRDAIIALTAHRLLQKGVTQVKRTAW
jgi:DDE superfamily endonuclease